VTSPPSPLRTLVGRFDATALELPPSGARVRVEVGDEGAWDVVLDEGGVSAVERANGARPDALLRADTATWEGIARDLRGGMRAFRAGRLSVRNDLGLGVGFLAATSGSDDPGRLRFRRVATGLGTLAALEAGTGPPLVLLHGLGATKISFLPTVDALARSHRMIALDLPGFGDSDKPIGAYDAAFMAERVAAALDALELDRTHLLGHSMGGRVALEVAFEHPQRVDRLALMTPSLAWLRQRSWAPVLRLLRPELGLVQPAPRFIVDTIVRNLIPGADRDGGAAVAADEFVRSYVEPRGRYAFYAAARSIYLEEPELFWQRLRELAPRSLFVWGTKDPLVPIGFMRHVERALPAAEHVELNCGHVPQLEAPGPLHPALAAFLRDA
jgi:pimeloyl-ACP methyl ester carboxylesterase